MNKEKALKIIENIKIEIRMIELEESRIYVESWVIGSLDQIESKINGGCNYYPSDATYEDLFVDFMNNYFCRRIDPAVKVYAIASLFTYEIRDMIINLFESFFDLKTRNKICKETGYIEWNSKWMTNKTRFEIIRRWSQDR